MVLSGRGLEIAELQYEGGENSVRRIEVGCHCWLSSWRRFHTHGYLDRLPAQSASHLVVYVGTYTHKEEGVSFFGFAVTGSAPLADLLG